MAELTMFIGLPGSGKSTEREKRFPATSKHTLFHPDQNLVQESKYLWTPSRSREAWAKEYQRFARWLGWSVSNDVDPGVWDATFTSFLNRAAVLNISKGFGVTVNAVYLDTPLGVCMDRNSRRTADRKVPLRTMEFMASELRPPTLEEGFDKVQVLSWEDS